MKILYNNRIVDRSEGKVDIEDRGFQFGDGIYEVIRFYDKKPFELEAHLQRLMRSAHELRLNLELDLPHFGEQLQELIRSSEEHGGALYIQVTRGVHPRAHLASKAVPPTLIAYVMPATRPLEWLKNGIQAVTVEDQRWLRVDIKSTNLLANIMAKQEAADKGAQEAILVRDGRVTEGSSSNFFGVMAGELYTHPANHLILNGITRQVVLDLAKELGIPTREEPLAKTDLARLDEAFITSTTSEICPVISIDGRLLGQGQPGPVTRRLQEAFFALLPIPPWANA